MDVSLTISEVLRTINLILQNTIGCVYILKKGIVCDVVLKTFCTNIQ